MGIHLLIAIHNHQPVGNFDWVFADAYERAYGPFLQALARHEKIRLTLHNTGPLLDWMEENRKDYLDTVGELVSRGQIEVMGGAYFEPIISIIPERDARAHIEMMNYYIKQRFGQDAAGMWLAERVWEPTIPRVTAPTGIQYTLLDDTHFRYAGLTDEDLFGYYITEYEGNMLRVFPIDKVLRYTIPFREPKETIARLKEAADMKPGSAIIYGDDGEKFGIWPGTYDWVFTEGWLEKFFTLIEENLNWITLMTFSEYIENHPPAGRIYLPTASYEEMMEWALPADATLRLQGLSERLAGAGITDEAKPFLRGGFFPNFLAKYPEANNMHKRMLSVSRKVNAMTGKAAKKEARERAKRHLLAAQCNCAYWHGLFGGLYLGHLRHAIYENLSMAEKIATEGTLPSIEILDVTADGSDEILVTTPYFAAAIAPDRGGALFHLDLVDYSFAVTNTLARRFEAYHEEARRKLSSPEESDDHPKSIHEGISVKEDGLLDLLVYDDHPRYSFIDRFFAEPPTLSDLVINHAPDAGDFKDTPYILSHHSISGDTVKIDLRRRGSLFRPDRHIPLTVTKAYRFDTKKPRCRVIYTLEGEAEDGHPFFFSPELNLTLLGGSDPKRYLLMPDGQRSPLSQRGEVEKVERFSLTSEYDGFSVEIVLSRPGRLLFFGVETASRSEGGLERTYQGTSINPIFPVAIGREKNYTIEIELFILPKDG
jgi:alpha-amylase